MTWRNSLIGAAMLALLGAGLAPAGRAAEGERYLARASGPQDLAAKRAALLAGGAQIVKEIPELNLLVVVGATASVRAAMPGGAGLIPDRLSKITPPDGLVTKQTRPGLLGRPSGRASSHGAARDRAGPCLRLSGTALELRADRPARRLGCLGRQQGGDRGRRRHRPGLHPRRPQIRDRQGQGLHARRPPLRLRGVSRPERVRPIASWPRDIGGPVSTDWNGHGSWIGGNIAAALNGTGINGIAPKSKLVALKIAENCGYSYDSNILDAFTWAAKQGVDIVSISFGGYLDRSDPDQEAIYDLYVQAVKFARSRGTVIVAAAGNEHAAAGCRRQGDLARPADGAGRATFFDYYGLYETPGGTPGVVTVSSTGNRVIASSASCAPGTTGSAADTGDTATCKPRGDRHQAAGQGLADQLAYYSNYGPRIDVAAPGGARKFNLPYWDRGGTPGFPYVTDDFTNVWEEFSTTSNWATDVPCFTFAKGTGFTPDQCYSSIQGTSMATPHVSAVLALIASARPALRGKPDRLVAALKSSTRNARNLTQVLSGGDRSRGDLGGPTCDSGYCHLGGPAVSNADAYGAGIVMAPQRAPAS